MKQFSEFEKSVIGRIIEIDRGRGDLNNAANIIEPELHPNIHIVLMETKIVLMIDQKFFTDQSAKYGNVWLNEFINRTEELLLTFFQLIEDLSKDNYILLTGDFHSFILGNHDLSAEYISSDFADPKFASTARFYSSKKIIPTDKLRKLFKNNFLSEQEIITQEEININRNLLKWTARGVIFTAVGIIVAAIVQIFSLHQGTAWDCEDDDYDRKMRTVCSGRGVSPSKITRKAGEIFERLRKNDKARLLEFISAMPKGGDLHHHYSGSIYAETYLAWAKEKGYLLDTQNLRIDSVKKTHTISIDSVYKNSIVFRNFLSTWSVADYHNHFHSQVPPDQHFFNTFGYFGIISGNYKAGLLELRNRAIAENVQYIETMLASVPLKFKFEKYNDSLQNAFKSTNINELPELLKRFVNAMNVKIVENIIQRYSAELDNAHMGIDDSQFLMRYQTYANRGSEPATVFVALYAAFKAARANPKIVGVNLVGPENGRVAMRDYNLHMRMFEYLRNMQEFRGIPLALHAGELTTGMVAPEDLKSHIYQAIKIANADRIGHGADIAYEKDAYTTMKMMANTKKAIEINLSSNEFILGVSHERHPISMYDKNNVPIVISTDDAGVLRSSLTEQFYLLSVRYHFSYQKTKELVYNSIIYSFLPTDLKTINLKILDAKFEEFEQQVSERYKDIEKR